MNRPAIIEGKPASLGEFLNYAEFRRQSRSDMHVDADEESVLFEEGPPCLQTLERQGGFIDGTKKDGMFNVGVYLKKKDGDNWAATLDAYNKVMANLKSDEIQGLVKQIGKKDYNYKCKVPPINACCNRKICLTREFGVGGYVPSDGRVQITLDHGNLNAMAQAARAAIRQHPERGEQLYTRGTKIVRIEAFKNTTERSQFEKELEHGDEDAPCIQEATTAAIHAKIDAAAQIISHTKTGARAVTVPHALIQQVEDRPPEIGLPRLWLLTETPQFDGHGVTEPGYNPHTRVAYTGPRVVLPEIPRHAAAIDALARQAVATLLDPVCDVAFKDNESKAVCLAAELTLVGRAAFRGVSPLFTVESPKQGTGKGLVLDAIGIIGASRTPTLGPWGDDEEVRKKCYALLRIGCRMGGFDNATGVIDSPAFAAVLTREEYWDRTLGMSEGEKLPNMAVWCMSANNPEFTADLARRNLPIVLDADVENPEDRKGFKYDPLLDHVRRHQHQLRCAALSLLLAFHAAGRPQHTKSRFGSFEAWDALVRSCVMWSTGWDPASTDNPEVGRGRITGSSNEGARHTRALLPALYAVFGDRPFSTADLLNLRLDINVDFDSKGKAVQKENTPEEEAKEQLLDVLAEIAPMSDEEKRRAMIGTALRDKTGNVVGQGADRLKLVKATVQRGSNRWYVRRGVE